MLLSELIAHLLQVSNLLIPPESTTKRKAYIPFASHPYPMMPLGRRAKARSGWEGVGAAARLSEASKGSEGALVN